MVIPQTGTAGVLTPFKGVHAAKFQNSSEKFFQLQLRIQLFMI